MRRGMLLFALLASLAVTPGVSAQILSPERGLEFGRLTPGVPRHVGPDDPSAARITIYGLGHTYLRLLPPAPLTRVGGGSIPLTIDVGDAVVRGLFGSTHVLVPGVVTRVPAILAGGIRIGGTASPSWDQPAGEYTATIVVQVVPGGT